MLTKYILPANQSLRTLLILLSCLLFSLIVLLSKATADQTTATQTPDAPAWMEPRGLSVIDAIGQVPESHLKDLVLLFSGQHGILQYASGSRSGNTVTVRVKQTLLDPNIILCPSMAGRFDEWPTVLPPATMRVFSNGTDVTNRLNSSYTYTPAGQRQPNDDANALRRYNGNRSATTQRNSSGAAIVPANMECQFEVNGAKLSNVIVEYQFSAPQRVQISVTGQVSKQVFSWVGPNVSTAGLLNSLNQQLINRFGETRTDGIQSEPENIGDADYFLVNVPPMPINAFMDENKTLATPIPGGGTSRVRGSSDLNFAVSTDNTAAALLPTNGTWKDSDLTPNSTFLSHFADFDVAMIPEYILPPGVPYRRCMTDGGCSGAILDQVWNARYTMRIYYYKVERIDSSLEQIPLKSVGKRWQGRDAAAVVPDASKLYLPLLLSPKKPLPDNPRADCPCGWFDEFGRMFDFTLPP